MPQSMFCSPAAMARRFSSNFFTVLCGAKPSGSVVNLSVSRLMSAAGKAVSVGWFQWVPKYGAQSTACLCL